MGMAGAIVNHACPAFLARSARVGTTHSTPLYPRFGTTHSATLPHCGNPAVLPCAPYSLPHSRRTC